MARQYWLLKSEPFKYPWEQLVREGRGMWDGVRNFSARHTIETARWRVVDVAPVKPLTRHVTLQEIKANPDFAEMALVTRARLSVQPCSAEHFRKVLALGKTKL